MPEILVIGAGISGLTAAYQLAKAGKDVLLLESTKKVGGKMQSEQIEGYLLEAGPNSLRVENQETVDLIENLGLSSRIIEASPSAKKRFILKNGNWIQVPSGPKKAIATSLFSLRGKLRVAMEPFIAKTNLEDEAVSSFISRRLGKGIFDYAADPFITGIYAGDPTKLSMRFAFPSMWVAEQRFGSLLKGMILARNNPRKIRSRIISFPNGLSEIGEGMRGTLAGKLRLQEGAISIQPSGAGFFVNTAKNSIESRNVIFATPAYTAGTTIQSFDPTIAHAFGTIHYPFVGVASLGYHNEQFEKIPEGFGGLIPSKEHRNILGIIFSSSNFPGRAPKDHQLLTVLLGGATHPEMEHASDEALLAAAGSEVAELLKIQGDPHFAHFRRWNHAIPQYNIGYGAILDAMEKTEREHPGLYFIGNYRGGISIGSCIRNATELAKRLV